MILQWNLARRHSLRALRQPRLCRFPNWEDIFLQEMEMLRYISTHEKKKENYCPNPYIYNFKGSFPKPPLGPSPLKSKKVQPNEIKEHINKFKKI